MVAGDARARLACSLALPRLTRIAVVWLLLLSIFVLLRRVEGAFLPVSSRERCRVSRLLLLLLIMVSRGDSSWMLYTPMRGL